MFCILLQVSDNVRVSINSGLLYILPRSLGYAFAARIVFGHDLFHVLLQVSDGLGSENVKALKNLCYDFIPKPQLETIDVGLDVFNALIEQSKYIQQGDASLLSAFLLCLQGR